MTTAGIGDWVTWLIRKQDSFSSPSMRNLLFTLLTESFWVRDGLLTWVFSWPSAQEWISPFVLVVFPHVIGEVIVCILFWLWVRVFRMLLNRKWTGKSFCCRLIQTLDLGWMDRIPCTAQEWAFSTTAYTLFLRKCVKQRVVQRQQHVWWRDTLDSVICVSANLHWHH